MRGALLPTEEYYRPQRAAELREKAERLDRLRQQIPHLWACAFFAAIWASHVWRCEAPFGALIVGWIFGSGPLDHRLADRAERHRQSADALEREHHALYGADRTVPLPQPAPAEQADYTTEQLAEVAAYAEACALGNEYRRWRQEAGLRPTDEALDFIGRQHADAFKWGGFWHETELRATAMDPAE